MTDKDKKQKLEYLARLSPTSNPKITANIGKALLRAMYKADNRTLEKGICIMCGDEIAQQFSQARQRTLSRALIAKIVAGLGLPTVEMWGKSISREQVAECYGSTVKKLREDIEIADIPQNVKELWGYAGLNNKPLTYRKTTHIFPIQLKYLEDDMGEEPEIPFHDV